MKEREIRDILSRVSRELDAARAGRVGSLIGVALVSSVGCGGEAESVPVYMAPAPDAGNATDAEAGTDASALDDGPVVKYGAPDVETEPAPDGELDVDAGPLPPYMAPDTGPQPGYAAPDPDSGPTPPYMAPDAAPDDDSGPVPPYGAPGAG